MAILNDKNIYNACYLLVYSSKERFIKDFEPIFNEPFGFDKFLNQNQNIKSNESQQINDKNGKPSGMIFNLMNIKLNKNKATFQNNNKKNLNKFINNFNNNNFEKGNNENIKNEDLFQNNEDELKFDSYSCINCKSEIELESIEFYNDKEDLIAYICQNSCGKLVIPIKDFLAKFKYNTYLCEKCSSCGLVQNKNINNIFNYSIKSKKIFCNQCISKSDINKKDIIKINEINTKCFKHSNTDFICYCFKDKINLCNECLNEGSHLEHFKINYEEISPIKIKGKNEEIEIFENIINFFKQKLKDIKEEKKRKIDKDFKKKRKSNKFEF